MVKSNSILKNSKAQAWGMDLIVAITLFSIALVAFFFYSLNQPTEARDKIEEMMYEGKIIANTLLSEGYPPAWNSGNVVRIGILTNNKIDETKLEEFYDLNATDYEKTKNLFDTRYEYWFFLNKTMTINGAAVEGLGNYPSNPKNLIKITRFTIYKETPITAYLYIWD